MVVRKRTLRSNSITVSVILSTVYGFWDDSPSPPICRSLESTATNSNSPLKSSKYHRRSDQGAEIPKHAATPVHIPIDVPECHVMQAIVEDGERDETCKPEERGEEVEG